MSLLRSSGSSQQQHQTVILMISALPRDLDYLHTDVERRHVNEVIPYIRDSFEKYRLFEVSACNWEHFTSSLIRYQPDILIFTGHASQDGIYLENSERNSDMIPRWNLVNLLAASPKLKLVIFNACSTEIIAKHAAEAVGAAIGMTRSIRDSESLSFSKYFFQSLAANLNYEQAHEHAKRSIRSNASLEAPMEYFKADYHRDLEPVWYDVQTYPDVYYVKPYKVDNNGHAHWECEAILGIKAVNSSQFAYKVKWKGFAVLDEYFHEDKCEGAKTALKDFHENNPGAPGPSKQVRKWIKSL